MSPNSHPPQLATHILSSLLPEFSKEAILGDMQETFAQLVLERGARAARRWYWQEALAALPGFAMHSFQTTQNRRQPVNGNIWNENWFGKQNSRLVAGNGFLFLLPALLIVSFAALYFTIGEARLTTLPGAAQLLTWMETGFIDMGAVHFPIGVILLGGLFLALLINVLAIVQINIENVKDAYRATFTVRRKAWNLILLVLVVLLGFGLDWLIT